MSHRRREASSRIWTFTEYSMLELIHEVLSNSNNCDI